MIDREGEGVAASHGRTGAAIAVVLLASGLLVLPVMAALGLLSERAGWLAAGMAGLAAVIGVAKSAAAVWGVAASID